ncbi:hypothetical protein, conserved [Trypanosoma brucei gambiense DAL972]|uniref:CCDC81 HU domain-containing protein n=1 Tax=Trypanosoma brucei gambiense (strain MHOM/CI/86/DAL972) TaxID=679716 RepID=D0A8U1_TRYB9|nr:hypothetical protein, conserved [Trypanosoma brucei gambiense DAL972]CBH18092.1 hypothetical protein, conserved [Trypanosoma brucei gambiense DAL972]|eukprot:XP_011780356.1 hypothetical protein, conserved [Trypanosoma brucei gambiense DAL972]
MEPSKTSTRRNPDQCYACYSEIANIVAQMGGLYCHQSRNAGPQLLCRIWRTLCESVEETLVRKRSCIIPDFLHASIKVQRVSPFDGEINLYKPQMVLLPDFLSKFHIQNVLTFRDAHYHATVPNIISFDEIAAIVGTDRHIVKAAVSESVREIGKYLDRNKCAVLSIDVGVAFLEFRGREYRIKWADTFLERLKREVGPRSFVEPYIPPTMAPDARGCRFQSECLTKESLHGSLNDTLQRESRTQVVEMCGSQNKQFTLSPS